MDGLQYHTLEALEALSLEELQALWELVPTDRQRAYKSAYEREVRAAGALGSDALERAVATELLKRYRETALVPIGSRWARAPQRVQEAARQAVPQLDDAAVTGQRAALPKGILWLLPLAVLLILILLPRLQGGQAPTVSLTATVTPTPTPAVTPTPTPLALEAQDDVIEGGDGGREVAYPVSLQVMPPDGRAARVWVVQRRRVQLAQWYFDDNPDTASFISGMAVRPVMGIPYSEENAAFFERLPAETRFVLTMNTGAVVTYVFDQRRAVQRSETEVFRQVSPGLALLLIGETDADGLPTATRTLITASYPPEQELTRDGLAIGAAVTDAAVTGALGDSLALGDAALTLRDVRWQDETLVLEADIHTGDSPLDLSAWRWTWEGDSGDSAQPENIRDVPWTLPAGAQVTVTLAYRVTHAETAGRWQVSDSQGQTLVFGLTVPARPPAKSYDGVEVRVVSAATQDGQLTTRLRIYNGRTETLHFTQDDVWLALGYGEKPRGPRNPAEGLAPFNLLPEQAVDLTLVWVWIDEPFATLGVGEYQFAIQLNRR